jgi:hypothetical protein
VTTQARGGALAAARARAAGSGPHKNGPPDHQPPVAELVLTRLSTVKANPVRYLVPQRIAFGKVHLVAGRGGGGKSSLMRRAVADWTRGRPTFGLTYKAGDPIDVLLLCGEDGLADTIVPGLAAEDADLDRVQILEAVMFGDERHGVTLSPGNIELIRRKLASRPTIKVIVIDPIASYVGKLKVDDARATDLRAAVLDPLNELAESTGAAVVVVAHLNKGNGEAVDRIAGSAAYRDAVRAAYLVGPSQDDEAVRLLAPIKWNLPEFATSAIPFRQLEVTDFQADDILSGPAFRDLGAEDRAVMRCQLRQLAFDAPEPINANDLVTGKRAGSEPNKVARCVEFLRQFLKDFAFPSDEIIAAAKAADFTSDNVTKAKTILKKECGLRNSNMGRLRGVWWSGFGHPNDWKLRPKPTPVTTYDIHFSPLSPESPGSPDIETQETQETPGTQERDAPEGLFGDDDDPRRYIR